MFSPPVTAAFVLGAVIFSVYYYFKSSSGSHQQQYEYRVSPQQPYDYSPGYPSDPAYCRERQSSGGSGSSQDSECTICIGTDKGRMHQVLCGHNFHERCLKKWLNEGKRSCPVCRSWI